MTTVLRDPTGHLRDFIGMEVEILRPLSVPDEADAEVGPMFRVRLPSGVLLDVFADELDPPPTEERD